MNGKAWNLLRKPSVANSSVATGDPAVLGHGIHADPKFFWDRRIWRQQTCVEKRLTAANCLYISDFWGLCPQTPQRGSTPGPPWWTRDFCPPDPMCHP